MKKTLFLLIILICAFVINGLVRSIVTLWEKRDVYIAKQEELKRVKKEHLALKEQEKQVNDPQFAEKEIRDKLFLVKPNEKIVVLPKDIGKEEVKSIKKTKKTQSAYKQWLALFLSGTFD